MCFDVEPGMRTAAAVAREAAAKISPLVLALSLLDRGVAAACIAAAPGVAAARAAAVPAAAAGVQQLEEVVAHRKPSDRVVGGAGLCE